MNQQNLPGPGDPETWGPPLQNTNDPRLDDVSLDEPEDIIRRAALDDGGAIDMLDSCMPSDDDALIRAIARAIEETDNKRLGAIVRRAIEDGLRRLTRNV